MQTFLPYSSFKRSAAVLDNKRLGKQRVETLQVMQGLAGMRLKSSVIVDTGRSKHVVFPDGTDGVAPITKKVDLDPSEWSLEVTSGVGWLNHPITRMWAGRECWLMSYQFAICREWTRRGFRDTCLAKTLYLHKHSELCEVRKPKPPFWLGNRDFHLSHQSNLVSKLPEHYGPLFPGVPDDLAYVWPKPKQRPRWEQQ